MSGPLDLRSSFFADYFSKAYSYEEFLSSSELNHQSRWKAFENIISLNTEQQNLISSFKRKMNVLCLAGSWCGDCARQCPILNLISICSANIELKLIDNKNNPKLADELRICGGTRVPTVVFLSEDFFEVSRFGDRTLSAYRRKAAKELGPACDSGLIPPSKQDLDLEIKEWLDIFERVQLILRLSPLLRTRHSD